MLLNDYFSSIWSDCGFCVNQVTGFASSKKHCCTSQISLEIEVQSDLVVLFKKATSARL